MERVFKSFNRNKDGTWLCISAVSFSVPGGNVELARGYIAKPGVLCAGIDVTAWLEENCAKPAS